MTDIHFTPLDPDELAAKVAEIVLQSLEPRLQALEQAVKERAPSEYLSTADVKRRFNIGKDLLRKIVESGLVNRYDTNGNGRYKVDELERYLRRYHVNGKKNEMLVESKKKCP